MKETTRIDEEGDLVITIEAETPEDGLELKELALDLLRAELAADPFDECEDWGDDA